jgi:glycosyltransferase involved in cell wall biosynthesis
MRVHQLLTALSYGDAIGDDALAIQRILRAAGHESDIYCQLYHPRLADRIKRFELYKKIASPDNVLIFHFSIGSPVSHMVPALPDRKILIYHNITPMEFFLDTSMVHAQLCYIGRKDLRRFARGVDLGLGDSDYNRQELEACGFAPTGVLPIIVDFSKFDRESRMPRRIHGDDGYTFMFVGRVIPNKKIEDVIRLFYVYQRSVNQSCRLFIVGDHRGFERYYWALKDLVRSIGVKNVVFTGHVTDEEVASYYRMSDIFVCMSEHEGFCVPLLEACHFGIPVLAAASTAVSETMRGAGLLFQQKDYKAMAQAAEELRLNTELRSDVVRGQRDVLETYDSSITGKLLLDYVDQVAAKR